MRHLTALVLSMLMTGAQAADRESAFGDAVVHYNAFNSMILQPAIAQANRLQRAPDLGVLNLAIVRGGQTQAGTVSGTLADPEGEARPLTFRQSRDNSAINYLAQFPLPRAQAYRFDITVSSGGQSHHFTFTQELFPGP